MQSKFSKKMLTMMLARLVCWCSIWQSSNHEYHCHVSSSQHDECQQNYAVKIFSVCDLPSSASISQLSL